GNSRIRSVNLEPIQGSRPNISGRYEAPKLPAWTQHVNLFLEHRAATDLRNCRQELLSVTEKIETLQAHLQGADWQKHLLTETDDTLEVAVLRAFREVGVAIERGPKNLADLLAIVDDTILCIEVKGFMGGTKDFVINQCEKWVTDVRAALTVPEGELDEGTRKYLPILARLGILPVGTEEELTWKIRPLLISNTYRDTPLKQRSAESFSGSQETKLKKQGVVAITSVQVLGIYAQFRDDLDDAMESIRSLLVGGGVSDVCADWTKYLFESDVQSEVAAGQ
ncbi:hypothetical protein ACO2I3_21720, partial [Leptospira interrogans]